MDSALTIQNLSIGFRQTRGHLILHEALNASLRSDELTCLLGANGSGKSTLIRTMSGILPAIGGTVRVGKRKLSDLNVHSIAKMLSIVLTYEGSFGGITAQEMVSMGRSPYTNFLGKLTPADVALVEQAMDKTATVHLAKQKMAELSDGERQKIMIAKSLAQQTDIILLDEPTAFLDFPGKIETLQLLRQMAHHENKTILLSTHDLHLALQFADRIWLLGSNKPLISGVPEDLVLQDKFAEFFNRNNTTFDKFSGEFIFRIQTRGIIGVEGNDLKSRWLKKALHRKGFKVDENKVADIQITTDTDKYTLQTNRTAKVFEHISGLLDELNNYNNSLLK